MYKCDVSLTLNKLMSFADW